jgi:uncharacterized membrane protein
MHRTDDEEVSGGGSREQEYGLGRILAISDGVYAFALTLLVVQLTVPTATTSQASLASQLLDQLPSYFSYFLSFAAIALTWSGHHETFKYIRRYDGRLIALNFGSLLLIAVLPFPTAILGRDGSQPLAAVIYAITLSLTGLFAAAVWWYATHRRRLVSPDLQHRIVRFRFYRMLSVSTVFLLSIPIALWRPQVAEVAWALLWLTLSFSNVAAARILQSDRLRTG